MKREVPYAFTAFFNGRCCAVESLLSGREPEYLKILDEMPELIEWHPHYLTTILYYATPQTLRIVFSKVPISVEWMDSFVLFLLNHLLLMGGLNGYYVKISRHFLDLCPDWMQSAVLSKLDAAVRTQLMTVDM